MGTNELLMSRVSCPRAQVAILKRIGHPNIIRLIEVLDDPKKDTLFLGMHGRALSCAQASPLGSVFTGALHTSKDLIDAHAQLLH